jgi:hypothetical protein
VSNNYFIFQISLQQLKNILWNFGSKFKQLLCYGLCNLNIYKNETFYNIFYCFVLQKMGTDNVSPNDKIENSCQLLNIFFCFAMID